MKKFVERFQSIIPKPLKNKYILTGFLFLLWILLFDPINLIDWATEKNNLRKLNNEKHRLEKEIDATTKKIDDFQNPDSLEKVAREQYYFQAAGEDVYIVED